MLSLYRCWLLEVLWLSPSYQTYHLAWIFNGLSVFIDGRKIDHYSKDHLVGGACVWWTCLFIDLKITSRIASSSLKLSRMKMIAAAPHYVRWLVPMSWCDVNSLHLLSGLGRVRFYGKGDIGWMMYRIPRVTLPDGPSKATLWIQFVYSKLRL